MLFVKRSILLGAALFSLLFVAAFTGVVWADAISPSQEQEFMDARGPWRQRKRQRVENMHPHTSSRQRIS